MKIYICPKNHKYDGDFFQECPHCVKEGKAKSRTSNGISRSKSLSKDIENKLSSKTISKEIARVKEKVIMENEQFKETVSKKLEKKQCKDAKPMVLMVTMPAKLIRNQATLLDFALFDSSSWREGADMLRFKNNNSIRDIKTFFLADHGQCHVSFLYKDEIIYEKDIMIEESINQLITYPLSIPDSRDRRNHLLTIRIEMKDYAILENLYLSPSYS